MAKAINETPSRTFAEYRLLPNLTRPEHSPDNVDLSTPLAKYHREDGPQTLLHIPMTSAVMQAVSGPDLSIALAREGGLSFIYCSQPIENQAAMIRKVKNYKAGFVRSDSNVSREARLEDILQITEDTGHSTVAVTEDGNNDSPLLGIITDSDYWPDDDLTTPATRIMTPIDRLTYATEGTSLNEANEVMRRTKKSCIPIVNNETEMLLRHLVFKKDYLMHKENPLELSDEHKRLMVGAGINTKDYKERVPELVDAGVDALVVDTSDGHSTYVGETLAWVKELYPDLIVGAGNVVDKRGFDYLADAGADFVKVGIGGGSICITQEQKGIGRGQATAVMDVAAGREDYLERTGTYIPICSDGGLVQDSHIVKGLAFDADFVMMGRYFARFKESPTPIYDREGKRVKPYWGEGSDRARNWQRYHTGDKKGGMVFEEGVDGYVPYVGTLQENLDKTLSVIRHTFGNLGVRTIGELHQEAVLEPASIASIREGQAHDIMMLPDSMQKYDNTSWG